MAKRGRPIKNVWRIFNSPELMDDYFKNPQRYKDINAISHEICEDDIQQWIPVARYHFDNLHYHNIYPHNLHHPMLKQGALFRVVDLRTGVVYPPKRYISKEDATYDRYRILVGFIKPINKDLI